MFLDESGMKLNLLLLWAKYKKKYRIKIYDFIVMGNHAHLILRAETTELLGNFMRTVNSQLGTIINKRFKKDSQAIKQRYGSPQISNLKYLRKVTQYVWMNRKKAGSTICPLNDIYCSLSWRNNPNIYKQFNVTDEDLQNLKDLIDDNPDFYPEDQVAFVNRLYQEAANEQFEEGEFEVAHTIGDSAAVEIRIKEIRSFRKPTPPP